MHYGLYLLQESRENVQIPLLNVYETLEEIYAKHGQLISMVLYRRFYAPQFLKNFDQICKDLSESEIRFLFNQVSY